MPVHPVRNLKSKIIGYQWGTTGKIYRGKGAKDKALLQGRAIERRKHGK